MFNSINTFNIITSIKKYKSEKNEWPAGWFKLNGDNLVESVEEDPDSVFIKENPTNQKASIVFHNNPIPVQIQSQIEPKVVKSKKVKSKKIKNNKII